jgi:hypothetical protein
VLSGSSLCPAQAPAPASTLEGIVVDPTGARVVHATVHIQPENGRPLKDAATDRTGHFALALPHGFYEITIEFPGFEPFHTAVTIPAKGSAPRMVVSLAIPIHVEEIVVDPDGGASTTADENKTAVVFAGRDLKIFSDDDATFQKQVLALAGGGPKAPQVYVNGFSGTRFPPKSSIREVRLNRNPYSALYDTYGLNRVEIFTKPGTEKLHGAFSSTGNDIHLNTANPYSGPQPPYYSLTLDANLNGPIDKKTSFFLGATYNSQQNNAAVNASKLDNNLQPILFTQAVPNPLINSTYSLRLDRQGTPNNTFTGSYQFNQASLTNGAVGLLTLPIQGFNNGTTTQTVQLSDSQVIGTKMMAETRFQYIRNRLQQDPVSPAPTIIAEGAFNGGGNPSQQLRDNQDSYELQHYFSRLQGSHFLRFGARYRLYRDANVSNANFNGEFIFPSLAAYQLTLQNAAACAMNRPSPACLTPTQLLAAGGGPSQYSLTTGQSAFTILTGDIAAFAEDEWKPTKNITLVLGFRFESQSAVPDHIDPAPRLAAAWAVHRKKVKPTIMTLRAGAGVFYDRFTAANLLTSVRQNGVTQQTFVKNDPDFADPKPSTVPPTIYTVNPNLHTEYGLYFGASAERVFGKFGRASVSYTAIRGDHQYLSRNINAPLPGTYDPNVPGSGTRPFGGSQNIYQFDSNGTDKSQILTVNSRLNLSKRVVAYLVYSANRNNADAGDAATFVSNSYNVSADYGRVARPSQTLYTGSILQLPFGLSSNLYFSAQKGTPFNITTGIDLNGDAQYNDRPTFATDLSRPSVVKTAFGNFDTSPLPGQTLIPINYGKSPNFVYLDLSLSRSFAVGPRPATPAAKPGAKPAPRPDPPFNLSFTVDASNVLNHVNPGTPIGVLGSQFFGKPISLANNLTTNTAANRVILLQMSFSF